MSIDGGYRGQLIENIKGKFGYVIISLYEKLSFGSFIKDWNVEKTFSGWTITEGQNDELTFDLVGEMVKIATDYC